MTRIRFNIPAALTRWRARPQTQTPLRRFRMMNLEELHEKTLGPGWFDSSWDLGNGLAVEVALPGDPPFRAWIEAQARPLAAVVVKAALPLPAEAMLEFEPVDWKPWAPQDVMDLPDLARSEAEPELELALV